MHSLFPALARACLVLLVASDFAALPARAGNAIVLADEPPVLMRWLDEGYAAEFRSDRALATQRYCAAAREGSLEGQYRLGRLLLKGGVTGEQALATAVLALAAQRGHEKARVLLAGQLPGNRLPRCLQGGAPFLNGLNAVITPEEVERYVVALAPWQQRQARLVQRLAPHYAVDPRLALAIVRVESNFDAQALSPRNAQGLMQLIPETAERFGVRDVWNAEQNARGGLAYLRWLIKRFEGNVELVSAAYNAGEGAVERHGGVPPYAETRTYVQRVLAFYRTSRHVAPSAPETPKVTVQARARP
ncbi:lytic transglycosylase domain-containing protein [Comamonas faecalis]|uniref:Lytic transglycosylase domain-containing protein n=1 Tax=Comamonas faecalis TaxID=1387849 RepID=A0ABP7R5K0_9BURK